MCFELIILICNIDVPQIAEIDTSKLEPEFQNLVHENGDPITKLYYNKGL